MSFEDSFKRESQEGLTVKQLINVVADIEELNESHEEFLNDVSVDIEKGNRDFIDRMEDVIANNSAILQKTGLAIATNIEFFNNTDDFYSEDDYKEIEKSDEDDEENEDESEFDNRSYEKRRNQPSFTLTLEDEKKFLRFLTSHSKSFSGENFDHLYGALYHIYLSALSFSHPAEKNDLYSKRSYASLEEIYAALKKNYNPKDNANILSAQEAFSRLVQAKKGDYYDVVETTERPFAFFWHANEAIYSANFAAQYELLLQEYALNGKTVDDVLSSMNNEIVVQPFTDMEDLYKKCLDRVETTPVWLELGKRITSCVYGYKESIEKEVEYPHLQEKFLESLSAVSDQFTEHLDEFKKIHFDVLLEYEEGIKALRMIDLLLTQLKEV